MADETGNTDTDTGNTNADGLLRPNLNGQHVEQATRVISKQPGLKTTTTVSRMSWEDAEKLVDSIKIGIFAGTGLANLVDGMPAGVTATRQNGGYGTVEISATRVEETETWNLDFMELQKPIRNWKADDPSDPPDMQQLRAWERLRDTAGGWEAYANFQTQLEAGSSTTLTGNTLKLAKMIFQGIEYFSVFTPVLTRISTYNDLSGVSGIGASIGTIGTPKGSGESIGNNNLSTLTKLATQWLKTKDSLQGAINGSFTRIETWLGAEKWNPDLYATAGTSSGGSGEEGGGEEGGGDLTDDDDWEIPHDPDIPHDTEIPHGDA